jgi:hypothetical protein
MCEKHGTGIDLGRQHRPLGKWIVGIGVGLSTL